MDVLIYFIPIDLLLGIISLASFFWALKSGQYDDPEGAASRILRDDEALGSQVKPKAEDSQ